MRSEAIMNDNVGRRIRVVLVDDEVLARRFIKRLLGEDPEVEIVAECTNGRDAVALIREERPDLVFLDVQMPEMDGFEATAAIRQRERQTGRHLRIVAMTAHAMTGDRERCVAAGMDDYLSKPIDQRSLYEVVEK